MSKFAMTPEGESEFESLEHDFALCAREGYGISSKESIRHRLLLALTPTRSTKEWKHPGFDPDTICALAPGFTPESLKSWMEFFLKEGWVEEKIEPS